MTLDKHNERLLKSKIRFRKKELKGSLHWLEGQLEDFKRFPDPVSARNLVAFATDLARHAQGLQDLMDVAEMGRGINLEEE